MNTTVKISELLSKKRTLSFEVFPPKAGSDINSIVAAAKNIGALKPDFMSVTYGAGGSTSKTTILLADELQRSLKVPVLAHLTCLTLSKNEIDFTLDECKAKGIKNIMALRGDYPASGEVKKDFTYASDLAKHIKAYGDFCLGGACYPEGHPENSGVYKDLEALKIKAEYVDFLTTQMFFDNNIIYNFMYKMLGAGISVPVVAGVMPITNASQMSRVIKISGTLVPMRFRQILEAFGSDPQSMKQAGIAYATEQIIDLYANGIKNVHVYSMNKPDVAESILKNLGTIVS